MNLPISRVAGGGKPTGPPSHLDLVPPESGALAQRGGNRQLNLRRKPRKRLIFCFQVPENQHQVTTLTGGNEFSSFRHSILLQNGSEICKTSSFLPHFVHTSEFDSILASGVKLKSK